MAQPWIAGTPLRAGDANSELLQQIGRYISQAADPDFSASFHTTTPPATTTHAITEYRIGRNLIKNAVEAERQGFAAMVITHFQDAGLAEVKSVVDIPVIGLGETTLMHSLTLGRKLGLVTINPVFIPWHEDQVIRYGLQTRVVGVRAVDAKVSDFIDAFADEKAFRKLEPLWKQMTYGYERSKPFGPAAAAERCGDRAEAYAYAEADSAAEG